MPRLLPAAALAAAVLAAYAAAAGSRVCLTAGSSPLELPALSWWGSLPTVFGRDFMIFTEGQYRPLSCALVAVLRTWIGPDATVFWRVAMLFFHWLSAFLVYLVARRLLRRELPATFAAAVFALHPLGACVALDPAWLHVLIGSTLFLAVVLTGLIADESRSLGWRAASVALYAAGLLTSKVAAGAPLFLLAAALLRPRNEEAPPGARGALARRLAELSAYALPLAPLAVVWATVAPHSHLFIYPDLSGSGVFWTSVVTIIAASGKYWQAVVAGLGIPASLLETTTIVFSWKDAGFLAWGAVLAAVAAATALAAWRRSPAALGLLMALAAFLPFANVVWNRIERHVDLAYAYLPVAGLSLLLGWVLASATASRGLRRAIGSGLACAALAYYACALVALNVDARTPEGYYRRMLRVFPGSLTARMELGRMLLARGGRDAEAFDTLLSGVEEFQPACAVAAEAYLDRGEMLAAAVHGRYLNEEGLGLKYRQRNPVLARIFEELDAYDYAEMYYGQMFHSNPFDVRAMSRLAGIWAAKGYGRAAERMADAALAVDPRCREALAVKALIDASAFAAREGYSAPDVAGPPLDWARYILSGVRGGVFRRDILDTAPRLRDDPLIQVEAAVCMLDLKRYDEALALLERVMPRWPLEGRMWGVVPQELYARASDPEFVKACERALAREPRHVLALRGLGMARQKAGDPGEAVPLLRSAVAAQPSCRRTRAELATALAESGEFAEAASIFAAVIAEKPGDAVVRHNLATTLLRSGHVDDAIREYREVLRLAPSDPEAMVDLADALFMRGDLAEAALVYRRALAVSEESARIHVGIGAALARLGSFDDAEAELREALSLNPKSASARREMGLLLLQRGDYRGAAKLFSEVLEDHPADVYAMQGLSKALFMQGMVAEATEWRSKAEAVLRRLGTSGVEIEPPPRKAPVPVPAT